jgi:type I restriction enzyme M protein
MNQPTLSAFLWFIADLLRGGYKQSGYGKVILPFALLCKSGQSFYNTSPLDMKKLMGNQDHVRGLVAERKAA